MASLTRGVSSLCGIPKTEELSAVAAICEAAKLGADAVLVDATRATRAVGFEFSIFIGDELLPVPQNLPYTTEPCKVIVNNLRKSISL